MSQKIYARKVLLVDPELLWSKIYGDNILVVFDDGELYMTGPELILSSYAWVFNRQFENLPLLTIDTIKSHYSKDGPEHSGVLPDSVFRDMLQVIWRRLINIRGDDLDVNSDIFNPTKMNEYNKTIIEANNEFQSALGRHCDVYMTGLTSLDLIDLCWAPEILDIKMDLIEEIGHLSEDDTSERMAVLNRANVLVSQVIKSDLILPDGSISIISWYSRRNIIKPGSTLQSAFARGYAPDIDGSMVPHLILSNLTEGMRTITDYMVLSRESTKAQATAIKDLQDVTVDGRASSNVGMSMWSVIRGNCGSTDYMDVELTDVRFDTFIGKYFITDNGNLRKLRRTDRKYIGKTIKIRHAKGCWSNLPERTCQVCLGGMAQSYGEHEALGPVLAKATTEIQAQLSLSFKHFIAGGSVDDGGSDDYIIIEDKSGFRISERFTNYDIQMVLAEGSLFNISDILSVASVDTVTSSQVARVKQVTVYATRGDERHSETVTVAPLGKSVDPTSNFLRFIRLREKQGKSIVSLPEYGTGIKFNLSDYGGMYIFRKVSQIVTPRMFVDHQASIMNNKQNSLRDKRSDNDYEGILLELTDLMAGRSDVNFMVMEVLVMSMFHEQNDYRVSRSPAAIHGSVDKLILQRSLSTQFIWKDSTAPFRKAQAYLRQSRGDSLLDVVVCPNEVLRSQREKPLPTYWDDSCLDKDKLIESL